MRRHGVRVIGVLLACVVGAGVTVGTSWLIAWEHVLPPGQPLRSVPAPRAEWPRRAPPGWPERPDERAVARLTGWTFSTWARTTPSPAGSRFLGDAVHEQARWDFGLPLRSLGYWEVRESSVVPLVSSLGPSVPATRWNLKPAMPIQTSFARWTVAGVALPLSPTWPGFALNTLFYAALAWGLWQVPLVLRRRSRKKKGACVRCGYDLRGLAAGGACPECGAVSKT